MYFEMARRMQRWFVDLIILQIMLTDSALREGACQERWSAFFVRSQFPCVFSASHYSYFQVLSALGPTNIQYLDQKRAALSKSS